MVLSVLEEGAAEPSAVKKYLLVSNRLVEPVRSMYFLTLEDQFKNLTSGQVRSRSDQGQAMTQVGQYAYILKRLDETGRLAAHLLS